MQDLNDKITDAGATAAGRLSSDEWNELPSEVQNVIESAGQTLTSADLQQLVKGIAKYCTVGDFFTGAGVVNAYTASVVAPMIAPPALVVGLKIRAIITITNTGAATLNSFGSGVINIKQPGGTALGVGELIGGTEYEFIYRTAPSTHWEVLDAGVVVSEGVSLQHLDFPTIDTADNKMGVTAATATNGGTVSIPAGTLVSLGEEVTAGETGKPSFFKSIVFDSVDLDISSTYYLRAHWNAGAVVYYTQKGTDADAVPAGLLGTPGGGSGGGFDSTVIDVLFAKVVTGTAGTLPAVTKLANHKQLKLSSIGTKQTFTRALDWTAITSSAIVLDWARVPTYKNVFFSLLTSGANKPDGGDLTNGGHGYYQMMGVRFSAVPTRYTTNDLENVYDDSENNDGSTIIDMILEA